MKILGSGTLAWFDCFTDDMLIVSMVENQQNNKDGGTHYLMGKIKSVLESLK